MNGELAFAKVPPKYAESILKEVLHRAHFWLLLLPITSSHLRHFGLAQVLICYRMPRGIRLRGGDDSHWLLSEKIRLDFWKIGPLVSTLWRKPLVFRRDCF